MINRNIENAAPLSRHKCDCKDHLGFLKSCPQLVSPMLISVVIFVNISAVAQIKIFFFIIYFIRHNGHIQKNIYRI